jgi:hypothetical protein
VSEDTVFLGLGLGRGDNDPAGGFATGREGCGKVDIEAMVIFQAVPSTDAVEWAWMNLVRTNERDGHVGRVKSCLDRPDIFHPHEISQMNHCNKRIECLTGPDKLQKTGIPLQFF